MKIGWIKLKIKNKIGQIDVLTVFILFVGIAFFIFMLKPQITGYAVTSNVKIIQISSDSCRLGNIEIDSGTIIRWMNVGETPVKLSIDQQGVLLNQFGTFDKLFTEKGIYFGDCQGAAFAVIVDSSKLK